MLLIRRWALFQQWLQEEDLDGAELEEWHQRARRRREGGGVLDEADCDRASRWKARVGRRGNAGLWAEHYLGTAACREVNEFIDLSDGEVERVKVERETLKREAQEARVKGLEAEAKALMAEAKAQRAAAERAAAQQRAAEAAKAQAEAFATLSRQRTRVAAIGAVVALLLAIAALVSFLFARQAANRANSLAASARAGELTTLAESLGTAFPDQSVLLAIEAHRIAATPRTDAFLRAAVTAYPRLVLRGHDDHVLRAAFAPDGKTVVTRSGDSTAGSGMWRAAARCTRCAGTTAPSPARRLRPIGKTVVTASWDKTSRLWDVASGRELHTLRGHDDSVSSAAFAPDGKTVVTASDDNTARLWDVASGRELRTLRGHDDDVNSAALRPTGRRW